MATKTYYFNCVLDTNTIKFDLVEQSQIQIVSIFEEKLELLDKNNFNLLNKKLKKTLNFVKKIVNKNKNNQIYFNCFLNNSLDNEIKIIFYDQQFDLNKQIVDKKLHDEIKKEINLKTQHQNVTLLNQNTLLFSIENDEENDKKYLSFPLNRRGNKLNSWYSLLAVNNESWIQKLINEFKKQNLIFDNFFYENEALLASQEKSDNYSLLINLSLSKITIDAFFNHKIYLHKSINLNWENVFDKFTKMFNLNFEQSKILLNSVLNNLELFQNERDNLNVNQQHALSFIEIMYDKIYDLINEQLENEILFSKSEKIFIKDNLINKNQTSLLFNKIKENYFEKNTYSFDENLALLKGLNNLEMGVINIYNQNIDKTNTIKNYTADFKNERKNNNFFIKFKRFCKQITQLK